MYAYNIIIVYLCTHKLILFAHFVYVPQISDSVESIREAMVMVRRSLPPHDTHQHGMDVLEHTISDLVGRVMERSSSPTGKMASSPTGKKPKRHSHVSLLGRVYIHVSCILITSIFPSFSNN